MKMTRRDAGILGGFLAVVLLAVGGYVWHTTRVPGPSESSAASEPREVFDIASAAGQVLEASRQVDEIASSGLFLPFGAESGSLDWGAYEAVPVRTLATVESTPRKPSGGDGGGTKPSNPTTPQGPTVPSGPSGPVGPSGPGQFAPAAIDVAITAVIVGGKTARALVESNSLGQSQWTDVPGEAFGYRIRYATVKGAVLEKDGRTYVLILGANRKARAGGDDYKVAGAAPETPPQPQMGGPGEVKAMEAPQPGRWQRYGGGGRGGFGGGPPGGARMSMKAQR